jgi:hypothetical protein
MSRCLLRASHYFWLRWRRVGKCRDAVEAALNRDSIAATVKFTFIAAGHDQDAGPGAAAEKPD